MLGVTSKNDREERLFLMKEQKRAVCVSSVTYTRERRD
uniref:Uncharacterized protein n=1 Tax=Anguilla anguilla TaxID=7936 RepID=A0A0E9SHV7_ANGAN